MSASATEEIQLFSDFVFLKVGDLRGKIEASAPLSNRRVSMSRETAARTLLSCPSSQSADALHKLGILGHFASPKVIAARDKWILEGWASVLEWYLWTRSPNYLDTPTRPNAVREATVDTYSETGQRPPRMTPKGPKTLLEKPPPYFSLGEALSRRKSLGGFVHAPLDSSTLGGMLNLAFADIRRNLLLQDGTAKGTLRSHGSAYSAFAVVFDVNNVTPGVYYYSIENHELIRVRMGQFREEVAVIVGGQPDPRHANLTVILVADSRRYGWLYRHERALRNLLIDAGVIAGRTLIASAAYGLQAGITPLHDDAAFRTLLKLDPDYLVTQTITLAGELL